MITGMETLLKVLFGVGMILVAIVLVNLVGALIIYAGWNWGLVGAVSFANPVSLGQAFWLSLLPASLVVSVRRSYD